jgi:hypothetical protein
MPTPISSTLPSLAHIPLSDKPLSSPTRDLSIGAHLTRGSILRVSGTWLNQQKALLTSSQLSILNVVLGALDSREAVRDVHLDDQGGRFKLGSYAYGAVNVQFQRDGSATDTVAFLRVDDKQGKPLLMLGQPRLSALNSADTGKLRGSPAELNILASSGHDFHAAWQRKLYIVPFYMAHGVKAKVVGQYMSGDALRFEVKNEAGDTCAVLKRTRLDNGEPVWMLPEHADLAGGNPSSIDGSVLIENERDLTPEELNLARAARNRYLYYTGTDKSVVEQARNRGLSPEFKTRASIIKTDAFPHLSNHELEASKAEAESNIYFTKRKDDFGGAFGAKSYAKLAAGETGTPSLMRSYFKPSDHGLEPDPSSPGYAKAFRTNRTIPAGYVLPSSSAAVAVTPATELFKQEFNTSGHRESLRINTALDSQRAAEVFRELQTPSPVDFPD